MFHPVASSSTTTKNAIVYATGRSVSIATATLNATSLEPTYPWDYDLDNDDDDDFEDDDDLAGEPYTMAGEDHDYQHPSLETSKLHFFACCIPKGI